MSGLVLTSQNESANLTESSSRIQNTMEFRTPAIVITSQIYGWIQMAFDDNYKMFSAFTNTNKKNKIS